MKAKLFKTYRELQSDLGRIDASFAYIELCLRYFEHSATLVENSFEFKKKQAEQHAIRVFLLSESDPQQKVYHSAVIAIHAEWDRFLYGLTNELHEFNYRKIDLGLKKSNTSRLNFFIKEIKKIAPGKLSNLPEFLIDICNYMRLLRNYYAHRINEPSRECMRVFKKLKDHWQQLPEIFNKLKLSSKCGILSFDDVIILTIAAKTLAEEICNRLAPELLSLLKHTDTLNFLDHEKHKTKEKIFNSLELFFFDRFGLDREMAKQLVKKYEEALV